MQVKHIVDVTGDVVITVSPDATIGEAAEILVANAIGAIVVTDAERAIAGILSERDIVSGLNAHGGAVRELSVAELMTRPVITCNPANRIADVVELMGSHGIRHLPVVDNEALVGVISIRDVLGNRMGQIEVDNEVLRKLLVAGV